MTQPRKLSLPYREPYDFAQLCNFLSTRSIDGIEQVEVDSYCRILALPDADDSTKLHRGWIKVTRSSRKNCLNLQLQDTLLPCKQAATQIARQIFDLDADPASYLPTLGSLAKDAPGLRLPGAADGFELAVRAVLGQQITVKAARTLATRFVHRFGDKLVCSEMPELSYSFPQPAKIARVRTESIAKLGIIQRRADTIKALAREIKAGRLDLTPAADAEHTYKSLCALPGIGDWTAQYLCMRALQWPDAFPAADYGVLKALALDKPAAAKEHAEQWRPWRAYAVMHLWHGLNTTSKTTSKTKPDTKPKAKTKTTA